VRMAVNSLYTPSVRHLEHAEKALLWDVGEARRLDARRAIGLRAIVIVKDVVRRSLFDLEMGIKVWAWYLRCGNAWRGLISYRGCQNQDLGMDRKEDDGAEGSSTLFLRGWLMIGKWSIRASRSGKDIFLLCIPTHRG
jgi:hypothetical protein